MLIHDEDVVWNFRIECFCQNVFIRISKLVSRTRYRLISSGIGSQEIATVASVRWDNCCAERMTKLSWKTKMGMLKWSSIFVRFNLNGADHTFHLFGWENFLDSTGFLSPSEKSAATIQCASFPHLKWVHIMPVSATKCDGKRERRTIEWKKRIAGNRENRLRNETTNNLSAESDSFVEELFVDEKITFLGNVLSRATTISAWKCGSSRDKVLTLT